MDFGYRITDSQFKILCIERDTEQMLSESEFKSFEIVGNLDVLGQSVPENWRSIRECTIAVNCSSRGLS
jgi:hypothetical protein